MGHGDGSRIRKEDWPTMLSSEELDENTRQQLLISQWAGILSYAPLISLALWAFGIGAGQLPATLTSIASTFSARVTVVVLAFPILLFMLPYWIGTQRGNRFRVALAGKMRDFTAKLADLLRTPLPTSYIPALAALQAEVLAELTPRERMVFELRHYQGLRLRRIGEILGTTEEAAKNCLFRATQKMRAALGDFV